MAISPKTRLSEFFRSRLDTQTSAAIRFFNNNADEDSQPPYGVVSVPTMEETTPRSNVYRGKIEISIVTNIDDSTTVEHDNLLEEVMRALEAIPRRTVDTDAGIRLFGWTILKNEAITKEESQSFSDVITIAAGCTGNFFPT